MQRAVITTQSAPAAIGPYSQAIRVGQTVYLSGQIALDPTTGQLVAGDVDAQARRAFANLRAVAEAAGGGLEHCVKLTLFLTDLTHFAAVNAVMQSFFQAPYPIAGQRQRLDPTENQPLPVRGLMPWRVLAFVGPKSFCYICRCATKTIRGLCRSPACVQATVVSLKG
jgi:reactive intermediate/imine deaminase